MQTPPLIDYLSDKPHLADKLGNESVFANPTYQIDTYNITPSAIHTEDIAVIANKT